MMEESYATTRQLTQEEHAKLSQPLYTEVQALLAKYSSGDDTLMWALRRKLVKQLNVAEKGRQIDRRVLKARKLGEQGGKRARCSEPLPEKNSVLDRLDGMKGYTGENTRLICQSCDRAVQAERAFR